MVSEIDENAIDLLDDALFADAPYDHADMGGRTTCHALSWDCGPSPRTCVHQHTTFCSS
ncbi:hypothetical protein I3F58_06745 [Streptomyces sp. MUM 203J]|uniref:hypothetical protein n=1 Tax=Streptomyces sp. MUM 203J TaxID=2791990 RepID=UPI001F0497EB|nr:hypothetical protein [Streptomyces sp. MUM 203J]MCH0539260.1 hypothetical protein [Streptomyces sp. MUM 203J]